jgi:hypothetical protein
MAIHVFEDAFISIANTELKATKITVDDGYAEIPATRMGDTAPNSVKGLPQQSITAVFLQDFSSNNVHTVLNAALHSANAVAVVVRPSSNTTVSASNPQWSGTLNLFNYKPVDAGAGEKQDVTVTFKTAGTKLVYSTGE